MTKADRTFPVIDLFAGPGGLGEGFASLTNSGNRSLFHVSLSIETERVAYKTLLLRSFFRQFPMGLAPESYYRYLRGEIKRETMFRGHPKEIAHARKEAWRATLGKTPHLVV